MMLIVVSLTCLFVYWLSSDAVFLACRRFLTGSRTASMPDSLLFWLSRTAGPATVAWLNYHALLLVPDRPRAAYVALVAMAFAGMFGYGRREWPHLLTLYRHYGLRLRRTSGQIRRATFRAKAALGLLVLLVGSTFLFGLAYPIVEHDSLSAAIEARIMVRDMDMGNYLQVRSPDTQTGYYMENFRIPFLQTLYAFFAFVCGDEWLDKLARTVSPVYGLLGLALLYQVLRRRWSESAARWGVLLLAVTPLFYYMSYNNGIDTARLALGFASLIWIAHLIQSSFCPRTAVVAAGFVGLGLFVHLLVMPLVLGGGLVFLAARSRSPGRKAVAAVICGLVAFFAGGQIHYLTNPAIAAALDRSINRQFFTSLVQQSKSESIPQSKAESPNRNEETTDGGERKTASAPDSEMSAGSRSSDGKPPAGPASTWESESGRRDLVAGGRPASDGSNSTRDSSPGRADPPPEPAQTRKHAASEITTEDRFRSLLEIRGQGSTRSSQLLFGRLQMFTGIEYFGWLFFLFCAGVGLVALKNRDWTVQDVVLLVAALLTLVIVLSGIRKLSWSNPRYVGSTLMIAAYFAAPFLSSVATRLSRRSGLWVAALILVLATPVGLVTAIRGAKVEITNPGTFYQDFRSLRWLSYARERPLDAIDTFFTDYFGIRKTARHLASPPETQLKHAHDYFAAVQFINRSLPDDSKVFLFRDARFFYYGERYGVVWYSPEHDHRTFYKLTAPDDMARHLADHGFTHVLVDDYSARRRGYVDTSIDAMLTDPRHAEQIYEYGIARVYRLRREVSP